MPLIAPVLDDRTFDQLRNELVNRIPVFNPEWTDFNRSDPAITLLELFAYLGEGLQFRFNQIPEATQVAFLQLLDLPLRPAVPARALVRCTTKLPAGARAYAGDQVKAGKVPFTVECDTQVWPIACIAVARQPDTMPLAGSEPELHAVVQGTIDAVAEAGAKLEEVATYRSVLLEADGTSPPVDFANVVDRSVWIAVLKEEGVEPAPAGAMSVSVGFSPSARTPRLSEVVPCPGPGVRTGPALEWRISARDPGPDGGPRYLPLRVAGDSTAGFVEEGVVRLELPAKLDDVGVPVVAPGLAGTGDYPPLLDDKRAERLWFWLRAWRSDESRIGEARLICVNALEVVQSVQARPELLGGGNGQPGQVFALANRPVLLDPLHKVRLEVQEGGVWKAWAQRDDLDASGEGDRHFTVDAEAGTVRFGERFPQIGERVRVTGYRHGGGAEGNVPADAISKVGDLIAPPAGAPARNADAVKVSNPFPAEGGMASESIEDGLKRIPGEVRRRSRAVTRDDFSELAKMTPGVEVGRAECMPLFHAPDLSSPRAGVVSVVVWPARDPQHPNAPRPDAYQLKRVCQWLDTKRLVTTELYVIPPTYRRIAISLSVQVKAGFGLDAVRDWVELVLRQYLAPLPPQGPDGEGWPLGRRVLARELEGVAMQVEGVEYVEVLRLAGESGTTWNETAAVVLESWEVPEVAAIAIVDAATPVPPPGRDVAPPPGKPVPIPVLRDQC
ncbi:putative baseplate assembly protein [Betaproteobacteria bacterium GR16-43]|nr:putative baseplate assembly protein [Betaproteobacteria bacterium GR16-43]